MGKFLKHAGSLRMVPLLPGRGWQEPAGCWMCWQPPGAKGAWWEQMPGLGWLLPSHSLRPRRQMAPSKTAGVAVLCFPGGEAEHKKHLNPQAHHMSQRETGTNTFYVSPQPMSHLWCHGLWERKVHIWKINLCACFLQPTNVDSQIYFSISISFKFINPGETACRSKLGAGWEIDRFTGS